MKLSAPTGWKSTRGDGSVKFLGRLLAYAKRGWQASWAKRRTGRLRLVDSLGLGERRSVAVLEVEGRRFLIGATPHAVTLLGELRPCTTAFERVGMALQPEVQGQVGQDKENVA
jgi:flagellar biogenesis protein FliO